MRRGNKFQKEENKFHKQVEKLLKKSGFEVTYSDFYKKVPDIIAEFNHIKIIFHCKYSPEGKSYQGLEKLVNEYSSRVKDNKAKVAVLAIYNYKLPKISKDKLEGWLKNKYVAIWNDNIINNYKTLARSIGKYAGVQIISDLGIKKDFIDSSLQVPAIEITQNGRKFYITKLKPDYLLNVAVVLRRTTDSKRLYQRYITPKRVIRDIPDYIQNGDGIFPNNIILASTTELAYKDNKLILPTSYGSFVVVDGQHRLYSFCNLKNEELIREYELPVTIFDGSKLSEFEQSKVFITINNNAKKIPPPLVLEIKNQGTNLPREIVLLNMFKKTPYFNGIIREYTSRKGTIDAVTFCTTNAFEDLIKDTGPILSGRSKLPEKAKIKLCYSYLHTYFKVVYNNFRKEWKNPSKYVLATNKGYRALLRLFIKILKYTKNKNDEAKYREVIKALKKSKVEMQNKNIGGGGGEGAAISLANEFAKGINKRIPNFDETMILEEVLKTQKVHIGEKETAEKFLSECGEKLKGIVRGELAFVDVTTISLLKKYFPNAKEFHIIAGNIKDEDKVEKEIQNSLNNLYLIQQKKIHERWLGDNNYLIDLNTDLKQDAIANSEHELKFSEFTQSSTKINDFDKKWKQLIEDINMKITPINLPPE